MGLNISLGYSQKDAQERLDHLMLTIMMKAIRAYEDLPVNQKGLMDEKEYWYRMALLNLTTRFSPWALQNHYKKNLPSWNSSPVIRSWSGTKQGDKSFGQDRPYTISEAEKLYGGGWVRYSDVWDKADSFGQGFKKVTPVLVSIVGGALAGGPIGAVIGGVTGTAAYIKKGKDVQTQKAIDSNELSTAIKTNAEAQAANNTVLASTELLTFDGPKLWALSILIILFVLLFFIKKKPHA